MSNMADYTKLKVAELKDLCRKRALPVSGTKAVLIARLQGDATLKASSPPEPKAGPSKKRKSKAPAPSAATSLQRDAGQTIADRFQAPFPQSTPSAHERASGSRAPSTASSTALGGPLRPSQSQLSAVAGHQPLSRGTSAVPLRHPSSRPRSSQSSALPPSQSVPLTQLAGSQSSTATSRTVKQKTRRPRLLEDVSEEAPSAAPVPAKRPSTDQAAPPAKRPLQAQQPVAAPLQPAVVTSAARRAPFLAQTRTQAAGRPKSAFKSPFSTTSRTPQRAANLQRPRQPAGSSPQPSIDEQLKTFDDVLTRVRQAKADMPSIAELIDKSLLTSSSKASGLAETALRFVLARFYASLISLEDESLGSLSIPPSLRALKKAVEGVYVATLSSEERVHFVEATGEPIGTEKKGPKAKVSEGLILRPDWRSYLEQNQVPHSSTVKTVSMFERVETPNAEVYPNGVGRHFRNLAKDCPELLRCAESYVLANSAPSSISGTWKTVPSMAAELDSRPSEPLSSRAVTPRLGLYLPPAHHVESVSFSAGGEALHPLVGSVQTETGRAHLCLRLTGQVVGNEEDGVVDVWRTLLDCDGNGVPR